jgi:D-beta-D-heptose 7-phosphate kinase/D-beta-D-heptose 1-phosphate adenosyltransferase
VGRIKNQYTIPGPQRVRHQEYQIEKDTKTITTKYSERRTKMKKEKVVIVSGYFDPLHVGHLEYFKMAKELGDTLVVILNNRKQALLKKGDEFMDEKDRMEIIFHLDMVDEVLLSTDEDASVCKSLEMVAQFKPMAELIFCKGGDRHFGEVPEADLCRKIGIKMVDGLGEKIRSSSDMTGLVEYDEPNAFKR